MDKYEVAIFAAGCFWGVESILSDIPGVVATEAGYIGGERAQATYNDVKTGKTNHAEAVRVKFDPDVVTYEELLGYFWRLHDPTTPNRQGMDFGPQYRSAIFATNKTQMEQAKKSKENFDNSGVFNADAVTEIIMAGDFYRAEEYHQNYFANNGGYACHVLRKK